jgi:hypothetical protein
VLTLEGPIDRRYLIGAGVVAVLVFLALEFIGRDDSDDTAARTPADADGDAFAGGYPVPPRHEQETLRG